LAAARRSAPSNRPLTRDKERVRPANGRRVLCVSDQFPVLPGLQKFTHSAPNIKHAGSWPFTVVHKYLMMLLKSLPGGLPNGPVRV